MSQRSWIVVGLISLLGLCLLAYYDEWQTNKDLIDQRSKNKIDFPKDQQILSLTFYHRDEQNLLDQMRFTKLVRLAGTWQISAPIKTFADERMVEVLLEHLRKFQYEKTLANTISHLDEFGISSSTPELEVVYQGSSGENPVWQVFLGEDAPVGYMVYFTLNSSGRVYLGSKHLALMLRKSPFDLREKRMLKPWIKDLLKLRIDKQSGESMELIWNTKDDSFKNRSGRIVRPELVGKLKTELEKVSISEFFPSERFQSMIQRFSAQKSWLELTLSSQNAKTSEFKIYLAGSELIGFNTSKEEAFKLPLSSLRYIDKYFDKINLN
ncbi:MAG: DUF4340 domain-containing protein [Oligoflexales bacterium]